MTDAQKAPVVVNTETAAPARAAAKKTVKAPAKPRKASPAKPAAAVAKAVRTPKVVKAVTPPAAAKQKKPKLVRDSFTIPKAEYVVLDELKQRAAKSGQPAKKSELLRAGIKALAAMDAAAFSAALTNVPAIKTGRPKQG